MHFTFFFSPNFSVRITVASKKKNKKRQGNDEATDSKEDEDSDESSEQKLDKKPKSKKPTTAKCKFSKTSMLSFCFSCSYYSIPLIYLKRFFYFFPF
jgi:hypothetical protein